MVGSLGNRRWAMGSRHERWVQSDCMGATDGVPSPTPQWRNVSPLALTKLTKGAERGFCQFCQAKGRRRRLAKLGNPARQFSPLAWRRVEVAGGSKLWSQGHPLSIHTLPPYPPVARERALGPRGARVHGDGHMKEKVLPEPNGRYTPTGPLPVFTNLSFAKKDRLSRRKCWPCFEVNRA